MRFKFGMLIALVLTGLSILTFSFTPQAKSDEASGEESSAPVELPEKRTANSDTFELEKGERETRIYESPVNYADGEGNWKPIEQELEETPSGEVTNGANSFDLELPEQVGEGPVRVSSEGQWISYRYLGPETEAAEVEGTIASYEGQANQPSFVLKSLSNGVKESILLSDPSQPSDYAFELEAASGVVASLEEDGSVAFLASDEEVVATMPPPTVSDAAGIAGEGAVRYSLSPDGEGRWMLTVQVDGEWLHSPDRSWPVVIDPTVEVKPSERDCIIANTTESQMCGNAGYGYLTSKAKYVEVGETQLARTLLRFNLSAIPKSSSLTSATIGLYSAKEATNVSRVDLYDISRWWGIASYPTWRNYQYEGKTAINPWTSPGGDYGKYMTTPASISTSTRGSGPGWWNLTGTDLTWLVQRWLNGTVANNGVLLKLHEEGTVSCCIERRVE